jgi:hypothetical protein
MNLFPYVARITSGFGRGRIRSACGRAGLAAFIFLWPAGSASLCAQIVIPPDISPIPQKQVLPAQPPAQTAAQTAGELPDIRDIRDPISIPNPWKPWLIGAGAVAATVIAALLLRALAKKLKQPPEEPFISPYDQALEELHASRQHIKAGQDKAFSIAVSDAVRNFLERQFNMPAPESTTEEFLYSIQDHSLIKGHLAEAFLDFLQLCDLAKFARQPFGIAGMEELYAKGEALIEEAYTKYKMQTHLIGEPPESESSLPSAHSTETSERVS